MAIVVPREGDFTVIYERAKATGTPVVFFGLVGAAAANMYNDSLDKDNTNAVQQHLNGLSSRSVFTGSLSKALADSGRFVQVQMFDKDLEANEMAKYDAVLTFRIESWGLRLVQRSQGEAIAAFVELESSMVRTQGGQVLWDAHDTVIGQATYPLGAYQRDGELLRRNIQETLESAGSRMASTLIYQ
jgi:hypothetical protein